MTWMELEGIMLSKISQSEKDNYHMISLICGILETRQRIIGEERKKMKQGETREGDKPVETLNLRKQTGLLEGMWGGNLG